MTAREQELRKENDGLRYDIRRAMDLNDDFHEASILSRRIMDNWKEINTLVDARKEQV